MALKEKTRPGRWTPRRRTQEHLPAIAIAPRRLAGLVFGLAEGVDGDRRLSTT